MKTLIVILMVLILALPGCRYIPSETESVDIIQEEINPKKEFAQLDEFLRKFDETSQIFNNPTNKPIKIKGKQGTTIYINPADLETENGQPVGKAIQIELKELSNRQQLLNSNAQTVSEGQLLVSGGAFYVNVTSEGQKVNLKEGKTYSVSLPRLSDDEMSLFYGQRDSLNRMNWKQADQKFVLQKIATEPSRSYQTIIVTGKDSASVTTQANVSEEEYQKQLRESRMSDKVYSPVALNQFGWINCDRFYKQDDPKTAVQFSVANNAVDLKYALVSLILEDINSIMQSAYYLNDANIEGNAFENVPVGLKARFLAVSYQQEKIYATLTNELRVRENHDEQLMLKEMSEEEFEMLMKSID